MAARAACPHHGCMDIRREPAGGLRRCVLVDQHEPIVEAVSELLEEIGVVVLAAATSGAEGIELCERQAPEIAVVGLRLPDMTGIEVARATAQRAPGTALILYTSSASDEILGEAFAVGYRGVARKAVPPTGLLEAVKAVLGGASYRDPSFASDE